MASAGLCMDIETGICNPEVGWGGYGRGRRWEVYVYCGDSDEWQNHRNIIKQLSTIKIN